MPLASGKALLHLANRIRRIVDANDIYFLEAQGDETDVRVRGARPLRDVRSLGELLDELGPLGFVRIHRNQAVHPGRVREIRPAASGSGWEVRLEPPVNLVLPVSRRSLTALLRAYRAKATRERPTRSSTSSSPRSRGGPSAPAPRSRRVDQRRGRTSR